jgi:hypothetical protein
MKNKGLILTFILSIGLFLAASFFLYSEYVAYQKRMERYVTKDDLKVSSNTKSIPFTQDEIYTLESFREQRNVLLGIEAFLNESALNYDPSSFSYANVLKEKFKTQLENSRYTQPYWNSLFESFFHYYPSGKKTPLATYEAIMRIPKEYINENIEGEDDITIIEHISNTEHWQNEIYDLYRSSENIETIWNENKVFFYTIISKSKYEKLYKNVISDLLQVHSSITQEPNYKEFYKKYNVSDSIFHTFPSTKFVKKYKYSWPFSFWDRRFTEKNDEVVLNILNEIKNHYEN